MIDAGAIMGKLQAYADTPAGKRKIKTFLNEARGSGKTLASGKRIAGPREMSRMANALVDIIRQKLPQQIASAGMTLTASAPVKDSDGSYSVTLSFSTEALHRDSLENDEHEYPGIRNIVALFNNGYHAKDYAYGWWNGHKPTGAAIAFSLPGEPYAWVRSRKDREGLYFMQEAVEAFNALYGEENDVTVTLGSDYVDFEE